MSFVVLYDACVLYPAPLRDLLVRLGAEGFVRAKWTETILDEFVHAILRNRPDLTEEKLNRTRQLMSQAIRDVLVEHHDGLADGLELPDTNDRHVVAAAIKCGAQAIVTINTRDFPNSVLGPLGIQVLHPDEFVFDLLDLAPGLVLHVLEQQVSALNNPPRELHELLDTLEGNGLVRSVAEVRRLLGESGQAL